MRPQSYVTPSQSMRIDTYALARPIRNRRVTTACRDGAEYQGMKNVRDFAIPRFVRARNANRTHARVTAGLDIAIVRRLRAVLLAEGGVCHHVASDRAPTSRARTSRSTNRVAAAG